MLCKFKSQLLVNANNQNAFTYNWLNVYVMVNVFDIYIWCKYVNK